MKKAQKITLITVLVLILAAAGTTYVYKESWPTRCGIPREAIGDRNQEPYAYETNVFEGKVIRHISDTNEPYNIRSQYEVEVIKNLKGNLQGTVIYDQDRMAGDQGLDPSLDIGRQYSFRTQFNPKNCWFNGRAFISGFTGY